MLQKYCIVPLHSTGKNRKRCNIELLFLDDLLLDTREQKVLSEEERTLF